MTQPIDKRILVRRERLPFVAGSAAVALLTAVLGVAWIFAIAAVVSLWVFWFFRDPERAIPEGDSSVVSPADGRVVEIAEIKEDRFTKEPMTRVSIFLNIFNVHVNRVPCSGIVKKILYRPGQFLAASQSAASDSNEQNAVFVVRDDGRAVVFVQIAGLIARRIVSWIAEGERVGKGDRFGMIRFGSRADLFLPKDFEIRVRVGETVRGGETIIGELK